MALDRRAGCAKTQQNPGFCAKSTQFFFRANARKLIKSLACRCQDKKVGIPGLLLSVRRFFLELGSDLGCEPFVYASGHVHPKGMNKRPPARLHKRPISQVAGAYTKGI